MKLRACHRLSRLRGGTRTSCRCAQVQEIPNCEACSPYTSTIYLSHVQEPETAESNGLRGNCLANSCLYSCIMFLENLSRGARGREGDSGRSPFYGFRRLSCLLFPPRNATKRQLKVAACCSALETRARPGLDTCILNSSIT